MLKDIDSNKEGKSTIALAKAIVQLKQKQRQSNALKKIHMRQAKKEAMVTPARRAAYPCVKSWNELIFFNNKKIFLLFD